MIQTVVYWLSEHPSIVNFRWSNSQSWGSTWSFLITSIFAYITLSIFLHLFLSITTSRGHHPIPLGPIPAIHSLIMSLLSIIIFTGLLFSSAAEIRDTRWFWRRSKTTFQWFLCFPLGTRPTGRVFFWSYIFYLTRFLHALRTFFAILRSRELTFFRLFNHSILICMSFLWLEFSQSFQVVGILTTTLLYSIGGSGSESGCPMPVFHLCNGIGAWFFNSVLSGATLLLFMNFYVKMHFRGKKRSKVGGGSLNEDNIYEDIKERFLRWRSFIFRSFFENSREPNPKALIYIWKGGLYDWINSILLQLLQTHREKGRVVVRSRANYHPKYKSVFSDQTP